MGMRHKSQKNTCFLLGTMAFALAHISFLVMLLISYPFQWADLTVVIVMPIVIKLLKKTGQFRFGKYEGMAILYSILVAGLDVYKRQELQFPVYRRRIPADYAGYEGNLCIQRFRLYFRIP